jgi:hypothetical protein
VWHDVLLYLKYMSAAQEGHRHKEIGVSNAIIFDSSTHVASQREMAILALSKILGNKQLTSYYSRDYNTQSS